MKLLNNLQFNDKSQAPSHHNTPLHYNRGGYFPLARGMKLMMPSENSVFPRMIRGGIIKTPNMEAESSSKPVPHSVVLQIGYKLVMMVTATMNLGVSSQIFTLEGLTDRRNDGLV